MPILLILGGSGGGGAAFGIGLIQETGVDGASLNVARWNREATVHEIIRAENDFRLPEFVGSLTSTTSNPPDDTQAILVHTEDDDAPVGTYAAHTNIDGATLDAAQGSAGGRYKRDYIINHFAQGEFGLYKRAKAAADHQSTVFVPVLGAVYRDALTGYGFHIAPVPEITYAATVTKNGFHVQNIPEIAWAATVQTDAKRKESDYSVVAGPRVRWNRRATSDAECMDGTGISGDPTPGGGSEIPFARNVCYHH